MKLKPKAGAAYSICVVLYLVVKITFTPPPKKKKNKQKGKPQNKWKICQSFISGLRGEKTLKIGVIIYLFIHCLFYYRTSTSFCVLW